LAPRKSPLPLLCRFFSPRRVSRRYLPISCIPPRSPQHWALCFHLVKLHQLCSYFPLLSFFFFSFFAYSTSLDRPPDTQYCLSTLHQSFSHVPNTSESFSPKPLPSRFAKIYLYLLVWNRFFKLTTPFFPFRVWFVAYHLVCAHAVLHGSFCLLSLSFFLRFETSFAHGRASRSETYAAFFQARTPSSLSW